MNDVTAVILADLGNLLSHLNIFQPKKHDSSCLICCIDDSTLRKTRKRTNFFTIPTSSDLMLLHSGASENEKRQLVFLKKMTTCHSECALQRELQTYLHFDVNFGLFTPSKQTAFAVLVLIVPPLVTASPLQITTWLQTYAHSSKKIFLIFPKGNEIYENKKISFQIRYENYEETLKTLVHISLIAKQRMRVKDLSRWFGASFYSKEHEDECVFI